MNRSWIRRYFDGKDDFELWCHAFISWVIGFTLFVWLVTHVLAYLAEHL